MRVSRLPQDPEDPSSVYLLTTAVVVSELFKVWMCLARANALDVGICLYALV